MHDAGDEFDVLIVGGGMVGASLACALAQSPLRIAVIETVPFNAPAQPAYDDRSIALAFGSRRIFEGLGMWGRVAAAATPIREIHVTDRGHFGATRMTAAAYGYDALGYVVESRALGRILSEMLSANPAIELLCPARVVAIETTPSGRRVRVDQGSGERVLTARLLVGADGADSTVRRLSGIEAVRMDYGQSAIIANLTPARAHRGIAYERFTESGPLALLPMSDDRCALVWTVRSGSCASILALPETDFLARLQEQFGRRLGRLLRVGKRAAYPLSLVYARSYAAGRVALIGNAAHTLHPIAGQGFNLGLRDVAALAEAVRDAAAEGRDIGGPEVLAHYEHWRLHDQRQVIRMTDGLVRVFSTGFPPLVVARNLGMVLVDLLPPLKRGLMRRTMGLAPRQLRLPYRIPP